MRRWSFAAALLLLYVVWTFCGCSGSPLAAAVRAGLRASPALDAANAATYERATTELRERLRRQGGRLDDYATAEAELWRATIDRYLAIASWNLSLRRAAADLGAAERLSGRPRARLEARAVLELATAAAGLLRAASSGPLPALPLPEDLLQVLRLVQALAPERPAAEPSLRAQSDASARAVGDASDGGAR